MQYNPHSSIQVEHTPVDFLLLADNIGWGIQSHGYEVKQHLAESSKWLKENDPERLNAPLWQLGWFDQFPFVGSRALGPYKVAHEVRLSGFSVQVVDLVTHMDIATLRKILDKYVGENTLAVGISNTFIAKIPNRLNVRPSYTNLDPFYGDEVTEKYGATADDTQAYVGFLPHGPEIDELFVEHLKKINPKTKLMKGGAFTNRKSDYKNVDIVNIGYGDITVPEILTELKDGDVEQLPKNNFGLPFKEDVFSKQDVKHSTMKWHEDDCLYPGEILPIEISRGCIFKCKFCSFALNGKEKGEGIRCMDLIREELVHNYENFGVEHYWIVDDTFNDDHDKMIDFMEMSKTLPFKLKFACYIRLDLLYANRNRTPSQAEIIRDAGIVHVQFGVETTDPDSAVDIGKGLNPMTQFEYMRELKDGVWSHVDMGSGMIVGLPSDTKKSIKDMANFLVSDKNPMIGTAVRPLSITPEGFDERTDSEFQKNWKDYGYEPTDKYMNGKEMEPEIKKFFHAQFLYKNRNGITFVDALKFSNKLNQRLMRHGKLWPNMLFKSFGLPYKEGDMITPEEFDEFDLDTVRKINEVEIKRYNKYIEQVLTK